MKDRIIWADGLRILAIYFVILVHVVGAPVVITNLSEVYSVALFSIAKTGVPLFFMLSGMLLLPKSESIKLFFKKRFLRIFKPYIFWVFIYVVLLVLFLNPQSFIELVPLVKIGLRVFWFVPIIFVLYLLTPSLRVFYKNATMIQALVPVIVWYLLVLFLPYFRGTAAFPIQSTSDILTQVIVFSGYYVLGFTILKYKLIKSLNLSFVLIFVGLIWTLLGVASTSNTLYYSYFSPSITIITFGIFSLFMNLGNRFDNLKINIKKILIAVSSVTFGVYILHTVHVKVMEMLGKGIVLDGLSLLVSPLVNALILFVFTTIIIYLLSRIPKLGQFIS